MRRSLVLACLLIVVTAIPAVADGPVPSDITAAVTPSTVPIGQSVSIAGNLSSEGIGIAGAEIAITRTKQGGASEAVGTALTDVDGNYSLADTPPTVGSFTYTASYAGDLTYGADQETSGTVTVTALATEITAVADPMSLQVGTEVVVSGHLTSEGSDLSGALVTVTRTNVADASVATVGTDPTDGSGSFEVIDPSAPVGSFTYTAAFDGDAMHDPVAATTEAVSVTKIPTSLALRLTRSTITIGEGTTLVATLSGGVATSVVRLQKRVEGEWTTIVTRQVGVDQKARLTVTPKAKATYRAKFEATDERLASTSVTRTVRVHAVMFGRMLDGRAEGRYKVYRCCTAYFYVRLKPLHPGHRWVAIVQYYGGGRWRALKKATYVFEGDGDATIFLNAPTGYRFRVRGRFEGDADHLGAKTPWAYFRFRS